MDPPGGDCLLDLYDPNDSPEAATPINATITRTARLCAWDDEADWWTFTLTERSYVGIEVRFTKNAQDVALELWDQGSSAMIGRSEGGAEIQVIHELLERGTYTILVERVAGNPTYTLETYALSTATPYAPPDGATRVFCPRFDLDDGYTDAAAKAGVFEDYGLGTRRTAGSPTAC
ncbi:hypothetical protein [Enhygromyxa salina]|uniref:hypothetical protein n=1 Tax=Enhygromyxa salina TaxID=215803 RepID=UPI0011B212DB|nr:hypothetical protein [Enhygromyxa salina]